jgi:D-alanine-D-alanine ligase
MTFSQNKESFLIWVIAPYIETEDPNLKYYYDYTQSIAEYEKVFGEIGCEWKWVNVTLPESAKIIKGIKDYPTSKTSIVLNLCDGDEANGVPGISIIQLLEEHKLIYTGANDFFYRITTSKIPMKEAFDQYNVPTPAWRVVHTHQRPDTTKLFSEVGEVLIVKPAISAGSMGLTTKNVVSTDKDFNDIIDEMQKGYRGWKLDAGGLFVEEFIKGREFTTLVVGSSSNPESIKVYPPVERVFHSSLSEKEQFLSFDRLWLMFDKESPMPNDADLYNYYEAENELVHSLKQISTEAFIAVGGTGYGRLDIRMDKQSNKLYVLEVNAQCGLSEDENYTSIGAILRFAKKSFTYLIIEIIEDALQRHKAN